MTIGVLTFHASINPGAFWQCFATCQALRSLRHDPIVLDYRNPRYHPRDPWGAFKKPKNWLHPVHAVFSTCGWFRHRNDMDLLPLGDPLDAPSLPRELPLDAIVVGSDVVWREPFDPVFFGQSFRADRMVAYATSIGQTDSSSASVPSFLVERTPFSAVSCRDSNTLSFLEKGHPSWRSGAILMNDPTVTLSVPEPFHEALQARRPYCMLYHSGRIDASGVRALRNFAEERNLELLSVFYPHRGMKNLPFVSSCDWMRLLLNAALVVTDAFHGTVLARLNDVPVVFVSRNGILPLKMQDQFRTLDLLGCVSDGMNDVSRAADRASCIPDIRGIRPALAKANTDFLEKHLSHDFGRPV